jgi:hypothetical protein
MRGFFGLPKSFPVEGLAGRGQLLKTTIALNMFKVEAFIGVSCYRPEVYNLQEGYASKG